MRRFFAVLGCGILLTSQAVADMPGRPSGKRGGPPLRNPETGEVVPDPPPRRGLCSWLPVTGLTAAPPTLGYWVARRNRRSTR